MRGLAVACVLAGCGDDPDGVPIDTPDTGVTTPTGLTEVPTNDLEAWLQTGAYRTWPAEADIHGSDGPHFGDVRTFLSPALAMSLEDGNTQHPVGSATVKELYRNGDVVLGHAVMVRVGEGAGDNAWYWYEVIEGDTFADDRGVSLCSGCHSGGVDFILTPWPQSR